jgi:osomolarity two-component system sensor histidine kinase NIK1
MQDLGNLSSLSFLHLTIVDGCSHRAPYSLPAAGGLWVDYKTSEVGHGSGLVGGGSTSSFTFISKLVIDPSCIASGQERPHRVAIFFTWTKWATQISLSHRCWLTLVCTRYVTNEKHFVEASAKPRGQGLYDSILINVLGVTMTLSTLGTYPFIPLVIILPSVSIDLKPALDFGIASWVTTPCCSMALWNSIQSALGNQPTRIVSGFTRPLAVLLAEDTR